MRFPGGKGKTYHHVINVMPPHRVYIETHLGGGAVMRHKRPAARNIGIDPDLKVVSAWSAEGLSRVELVRGRAEDFFAQYEFRGDELVYSDPPYHPQTRRQPRVYNWDYSVEDHERLLALLVSLPCMVILSGYANSLYSTSLVGWRTRTFQAKTHTDVREETLWFNFEPPQILHDSRYLGTDFRTRQTTKRRLQRLRDKVARMDPVERAVFLAMAKRRVSLHIPERRAMTQTGAILTRTGTIQIEFPSPDALLINDVRWGAIDAFPTPAYWQYQVIARRLAGRPAAYKLGHTLSEEVAACVLGGHGIPAPVGIAAYEKLRKSGAFAETPPSVEQFEAWLREPLQVGQRKVRYRFAAQKAR